MILPGGNRFEVFFADDGYIALKNLLYNYRLRKRAIKKCMRSNEKGLILEVGSGLSPMVTDSEEVVYSEVSFSALKNLKKHQGRCFFVVADAVHLPFKAGLFTQVICSEVLEHLPDDRTALRQMAEVMKPGAALIITFPHRRGYFAGDDRFVNHFRRYELSEMDERLRDVGLNPVEVQKVLGPLEKMTMVLVTAAFSLLRHSGKANRGEKPPAGGWRLIAPLFKIMNWIYCLPVWLDARLAPRFLSSVLLIRAVKRDSVC